MMTGVTFQKACIVLYKGTFFFWGITFETLPENQQTHIILTERLKKKAITTSVTHFIFCYKLCVQRVYSLLGVCCYTRLYYSNN